ncbi:MAG TPA: hypothetical protein PKW33_01380 [Anaerolineaceae bacterium]|nr:hypothetical protein [Anaerolineaceae bacterium]HPN50209.1 hypothetical protein [Anaerolineaceae bacterium]
MRTPAGKECRFFYGDYYRGRNLEECRLLSASSAAGQWKPALCCDCPVPGILQANACPTLVLHAQITNRYIFFGPQVKVTATCTKSGGPVKEPHIGCGQCHPLPDVFLKK